MRKAVLISLLAVGLVAGCSDMSREQQARTTGQVLGGVAGAAVGSQFGSGTGRILATVAGGAVGAAVGGEAAATAAE